MKLIVIAVLLSINLFSPILADLCDPTLCPAGVTNVGCNSTGLLAASCPADAEIVTLTTAMKQEITKRHNQKRHLIASGGLSGFDPALRMATIRWNADLAAQANANAIGCVYAHDQCRATAQFPLSGQNIAKTWWSGGSPVDLTTILGMVDLWWGEYVDATMADINSLPANPPNTIGHFTVITGDRNTALGCAVVKYTDAAMNNWKSLTLVCNYARTNIIGSTMYKSGTTASGCTTGTNPNFPALCSLSEPYNVKSY